MKKLSSVIRRGGSKGDVGAGDHSYSNLDTGRASSSQDGARRPGGTQGHGAAGHHTRRGHRAGASYANEAAGYECSSRCSKCHFNYQTETPELENEEKIQKSKTQVFYIHIHT